MKNGKIWSKRFKKNIGSIGNYGYITVGVNNSEYYYVHRIIWVVANGCDIPEGYDIHHKDGNKLNNNYLNLELIEHSEHNKHKKKKVGKYSLDGELLKIYNGGVDAKEDGFTPSKVSDCCKGYIKKYKNFIWKFI